MTTIETPAGFEDVLRWLRGSVLLRIFGLAWLILILQIPIGMIGGTIAERRERRAEAVSEVTNTWGGRQTLHGPFLIVPYLRRWTEKAGNGAEMSVAREAECYRYVLPETVTVDGDLASEVRRRGIFDVPLYVARLTLAGSFRLPAMEAFPPDTAAVRWERAELALGIADPRAIRESTLRWREEAIPVRPGPGPLELMSTGVSAAVPIADASPAGTSATFTMTLTIAGSDGILVLPVGSETTVRLRSPWPDPSFEGAYLPVERVVTPQGFTATWHVSELARGFPAGWKRGDVERKVLDEALLGATLVSPVDAYRTTDRAVKYELLFVGLTFLAFFLFELVIGLRVHPVQYLLVGLALCLFYLVLLSLAEHVGFDVAYAVASSAIAGLVSAYSRTVLGSRGRTAAIGGLVVGLYLYLFVLLQIQDYALLVGSAVLFAILATVMFATRRVDWYTLHRVETPAVLPGS